VAWIYFFDYSFFLLFFCKLGFQYHLRIVHNYYREINSNGQLLDWEDWDIGKLRWIMFERNGTEKENMLRY